MRSWSLELDSSIHQVASLDYWSECSWAYGVQVERLAPLDGLTVRTRNSCYELTVTSPAAGEVLVRGGRFFPTFTRAWVSGSSLGGGCLKMRGIYVGFLLELEHEGQTVRTTHVTHPGDSPRPLRDSPPRSAQVAW